MTIRDQGLASLRTFRKVSSEDAHNIQTHINSIATLVSFPKPNPFSHHNLCSIQKSLIFF